MHKHQDLSDASKSVKFQSQQYRISKRGSRDIEVYVSTIKKRIKPVVRGK